MRRTLALSTIYTSQSLQTKPQHIIFKHLLSFSTKERNMKTPSPSKSSTTTPPPQPPPSSPQHREDDVVVPTQTETNPTNEGSGEGERLKNPMEVVEELGGGDGGDNDGGSGSVPLGGGGGLMSSAVAVGVGGSGGGIVISDGTMRNIDKRKSGVTLVVKEKEKGQNKKPRLTEVKDPPTGTPTCPICHRQFQSWKGAFGHMRTHPDREYRGFFRPPVFGSSSSPSAPALAIDVASKGGDAGGSGKGDDGEKNTEENRAASPRRGVGFDLNCPLMEEEGSSSGAAGRNEEARDEPVVAEEMVQEEGKNPRGFDLNEMPKNDDNE